jgi:monoterpene epsilon-lactone hydrolase
MPRRLPRIDDQGIFKRENLFGFAQIRKQEEDVMNRSIFIAASTLAIVAGASALFAQQASSRPGFAADGTVSVPAFELPPSPLLSPEALAQQQARAKMPSFDPAMDVPIAIMRAATERALAPRVAVARERYPVEIVAQVMGGVKTRVITPKAGEASRDRVLINLHGGGFQTCADNCALVESIPIAALGRFKVVTVDYRQGPENIFPAASEDVAAVYKELLKTYRPDRIGVYGCSAGGALTAQAASWFYANKLPMPGAIGIFGAGGVRFEAGDSAYVAAYIDGSFPPPGKSKLAQAYFKGAKMDDPLVSPALYPEVIRHFPPTLIITGTRAMDMSPAVYTNSALLKAGVDSRLIVGEGMGHCYIYSADLPEARDAYDQIVTFFDAHLGGRKR